MNTVHFFKELSQREAYDETQCNDDIKDGDIIICNGGATVAILIEAWPTCVKGPAGDLHDGLAPGFTWEELDGGKYLEAYGIAMAQ